MTSHYRSVSYLHYSVSQLYRNHDLLQGFTSIHIRVLVDTVENSTFYFKCILSLTSHNYIVFLPIFLQTLVITLHLLELLSIYDGTFVDTQYLQRDMFSSFFSLTSRGYSTRLLYMITPAWVWVVSSSSAWHITNNYVINSIGKALCFHLALEIRCININLGDRHLPCRIVNEQHNIKLASVLILRNQVFLYYYSTTASISQDINRLLSNSTFHNRHFTSHSSQRFNTSIT